MEGSRDAENPSEFPPRFTQEFNERPYSAFLSALRDEHLRGNCQYTAVDVRNLVYLEIRTINDRVGLS